MSVLPDINLNEGDKKEYHAKLYWEDLVKSVSIYIVSRNLKQTFYNFSDFFFKNKIDDDNIKLLLKDKIIELLKNNKYSVAYVFNDTGLIIVNNKEDLDKSVWRSNLDYKEL